MDCLFCKIVADDIASTKVYEEDRILAFMDINPVNKGHLLVVPTNHTATIYEIGSDDLTSVMTVAQRLPKLNQPSWECLD
jgi:histidine triad (HIT) family protein